jgi:hypothetical protein
MAIASFQLDPAAGGVSQAAFDAHTHNYRKLMQLAVSRDHTYDPVERFDIVDDSEVVGFSGNNIDLEAIGVTVSTEATGTPL